MRKLTALAFLGVLVATGCTRIKGEEEVVARAIYVTESKPRTFTYNEKTADRALIVRGTVEDDYRYDIRVGVDGEMAEQLVAYDDARAVRFTSAIEELYPDGGASAGLDRELLSTIGTDRWAVDPLGASALFTDEERPATITANDPLLEGIEVLKYLRRSIGEAATVLLFNPDSQDYRPKFDRFPPPVEGEIRYDLVPPVVEPRDPSTAAGNAQQLPGTRYFRRMSVYVRDDAVVRIRERISVADMLADPRSRLDARIGDYGIVLPEDKSVRAQAAFALQSINQTALRLNQPIIRERTLDVRFDDLDGDHQVALPKDAQRAKLGRLQSYGQILYERPSS